ncbi:outer membrane beta-barrel protein [Cognatitamlana onchidii]|uniref:outer membrane beta-barrel protein n=1 Tax=Cognatitamlana onchidii TaxID=2562860 RepID=UPI0010A5C770|nr:outer membrane beta-barrel family protein [Algibacter onchidii]
MTYKIVFSFIFLIQFFSFSQELGVKGMLTDTNKVPIPYANVVLLDSKNSEPQYGATTNESGTFYIQDVVKDTYTLKISYLGFKPFSKEININTLVDLGLVILEENREELEDVTIVAKRPTVKRYVDRLVFNVENSTLSNNNVLDVLKHTPGVIVHDGAISVKQTTPIVYLNDRRVYLSEREVVQLLEGTTANDIKSIEVITNPPAKYDAEGGSVLNIISNKNIAIGYHGSIYGNYKQGFQFPKYSLGTSHYFKTKKLSTYINYNISPRKDFRNNLESINFIQDEQIISSWETDYKRTRKTANQNINVNLDYEFDKNNRLGFSSNVLIAPRDYTKTNVNSNTEVFSASKVLDSTFNTENRSVDETYNMAFNADYIHKFDRAGEKINVSAHYTDYEFSSFQNVDTDYLFPDGVLIRNNRFQTFSNQKIKLYTGQLDYELPFDNGAQFETGMKVSKIESESVLDQYSFENEVNKNDLENSDVFIYDETNYAAYMSYANDWGAWSLKTGLRTEYTNIKGNSLSNKAITNNDYLKFFPSINILNRLNDENEIYVNYNRRIYRPKYTQLNPFKYFLNDNAYVSGNPNLQPQIDDVITLGYTFNTDYTFEIYYRIENDPILDIVFQDNEEKLLKYVSTNIDRSISYGLDFTTYTGITNIWNLYVLSSVFYYNNQYFALESDNSLIENDQWSFYGQAINYFSFLKDKSLTLDVGLTFISRIADGPSIISNRFGFDINLRKALWNNRASFNVGINDAFNTQNFTQTTKYLNQDIYLSSNMENRLLIVGFNYKFGNFNLKNNSKKIELQERERLGNAN